MKKCLLGMLLFLLVVSCQSGQTELRQLMRWWIGKEIQFVPMEAKAEGRDTCWTDWKTSQFKILHYVDTAGCTSCRLRLYDWGRFMDSMAVQYPEMTVLFVLSLKDYEEFEYIARVDHFNWPVIYDKERRLDSLNHFPANPAFQTFLLDVDNKVLAIGDPVKNRAVRKLYNRILESEI